MSQFKPKYVKKILIDTKRLYKGIKKAAIWATNKFKNDDKPPLFLCLLKGCLPFFSTLITNIDCDLIIDFMVVRSYKGAMTSNSLPEIVTDILADVKDRNVIICDDVVDTGKTLFLIKKHLQKKGAKKIHTLVLIDKPNGRKIKFKPDYACFKINGTPFLVGYGMDIYEQARNLPYLAEFDKKYLKTLSK